MNWVDVRVLSGVVVSDFVLYGLRYIDWEMFRWVKFGVLREFIGGVFI